MAPTNYLAKDFAVLGSAKMLAIKLNSWPKSWHTPEISAAIQTFGRVVVGCYPNSHVETATKSTCRDMLLPDMLPTLIFPCFHITYVSNQPKSHEDYLFSG
jgi:hypothetical protein